MTHAPSSLITVLGLLACGSLQVDRSFVEEGALERVRVRWAAGDVHVRAGTATEVKVRVQAWGPEAPLAFSHERDAEILVIELRCQSPVPCGGTLDLDVPAGTALETDLGDGAADLSGPLGHLSVVVGSGSIVTRGLTSEDAVLQVVRGPVRAGWSKAPRRAVVASVHGDVRVMVPPGAYDVQSGGDEPAMYGIVDDPAAANVLRITALDGQAVVEGTGSIADARTFGEGRLVTR
jgi:hypothetical protein